MTQNELDAALDVIRSNEQAKLTATILSGLLASGDYTEPADRFSQPRRLVASYRSEVVEDALKLAKEIITKTQTL